MYVELKDITKLLEIIKHPTMFLLESRKEN